MRWWTLRAIGASFIVICVLAAMNLASAWLLLPWAALSIVAYTDVSQPRHSIRRNFPIVGHFRYLFESIRPEINQYFIESNTDGQPFNRETRSVVYQRAKRQRDTLPFGTRHNVYDPGYECVRHSMMPVQAKSETQRVLIGGPQCERPYDSSVFVISAMSFGALSDRAVEALNLGARQGSFAHNSGEGGLSPHHLKHGGDLIWQIGTGYFGCRDESGNFDSKKFEQNAANESVKMIEIKISQGAKPALGGLLPGAKVTAVIAKARGIPVGKSAVSPSRHSAFNNFEELCHFVGKLRSLSGGKPVGIKLCVGDPAEFQQLCEAMLSTGIWVDFVTVDGSEGGTGAAPLEFTNHVGLPLYDALVQVDSILRRHALRPSVKIIASGKIATGFDVVRAVSLGADLCASARGMMLALGCIQALRCDSNHCPTGIATQNPRLVEGLVVEDKAIRIASFHKKTIDSVAELLGAMGVSSTTELTSNHVLRRDSDGRLKTLAEIYGITIAKKGTNFHEQENKVDHRSRHGAPVEHS